MWSTFYWFSHKPIINITFSFTNIHLQHQQFVKFFVEKFVSLALLLSTIVASILWFLVDNLFLMISTSSTLTRIVLYCCCYHLWLKNSVLLSIRNIASKNWWRSQSIMSYHYLLAHQFDCISGLSSHCRLTNFITSNMNNAHSC